MTFYISQVPFSLQTTNDSLSATICRCDADNNQAVNICENLEAPGERQGEVGIRQSKPGGQDWLRNKVGQEVI